MTSPTKVNGTKSPNLFIGDELDFLKIYNKEQLEKLWKSVLPDIKDVFKNYKPYIVYLGVVDGVELYQVNGDDNFTYITGRSGAQEADNALKEASKLFYDKNGK